ncbi:MAG: hypothetical protein E6Q62_00860 [Nitrosomonas sp.]|nr:MAG: hypothetical protein E6Q62_00860 [Nitrosomonas sp.]
MRTLKLLISLFALTMLVACAQMNSSLVAPTGIANNDHRALIKHYEGLAREAKIKLEENKAILEAYEARPYYYGRQGLDLQSHASANIREHTRTLKQSLEFANLHRRLAMEQQKKLNQTADANDRNLTVENSEYFDNKGL